jgi:hypothetical protein
MNTLSVSASRVLVYVRMAKTAYLDEGHGPRPPPLSENMGPGLSTSVKTMGSDHYLN